MARSKAASPSAVRPEWTNAVPRDPITSASRSTAPVRRAKRSATSQLTYASVHIADVAKNNSHSLMCYRRLMQARTPR